MGIRLVRGVYSGLLVWRSEEGEVMRTVAALYVRKDSIYKTIPGVDCYDIDRGARTFPGGMPVIAHPPCRLWGRLRQFSTAPTEEMELARHAVLMVKKWGGVLEHPAGSLLWKEQSLPVPGNNIDLLDYTIDIDQSWFGYPAKKRTWLYIVGVPYSNLPAFPLNLNAITRTVASRIKKYHNNDNWKLELPKSQRDVTVMELAEWLVIIARMAK